MTYYLLYDPSTGQVSGNGFTPDNTFPPHSLACTEEEARSPFSFKIQNGKILKIQTEEKSPQQQAYEKLLRGFSLECRELPEIYGCLPSDQQKLTAVTLFIRTKNGFPENVPKFPWPDISGKLHFFPSPEIFENFAAALAKYICRLDMLIAGHGTKLPPDLFILHLTDK